MPTSELLDKIPPHSAEAELKCIGAVMRNLGPMFDQLRLVPDDFYVPVNRAIWTAYAIMREARIPLDDSKRIQREIKAAGSSVADAADAMVQAIGEQGFTVHAEHYAAQVKTFAQRRTIQRSLVELFRAAWNEDATVEEILAECETTLSNVKTGRYDTDPVSMETAIMAAVDLAERAIERGEHLGVPSGFSTFDQEIGGFFAGELCILAARTGIGKTSLAMQYAVNAARMGRRVYIATLEMRYVEVALKLLCSAAGVKTKAIRTGKASREELKRMIDKACSLSALPMALHDWPQLRAYDIRRAARKFKADLIIVDYLTLVTPVEKKGRDRYQQVDQIVKDLKATARELQIPVLALAQINREAEKQGKDTRPKLHQIRECGGIEMDADMVAILHRVRGKQFEAKNDESGQIEKWDADLDIAKARLGSEAQFRLDWHPGCEQYAEHGFAVPGQVETAPNYEPSFAGDF